jgi:hypothetical protein
MAKCSKEITPQAAVTRVGHDGKEVKDAKTIDPTVADDLDPWHFQKGEMAHFTADCTEAGDSREVQMVKMTRRKHLLQRKNGLKFHLTRCLKCALLWRSPVLC